MKMKLMKSNKGMVFITVVLMAVVLETFLGMLLFRQAQEQRLVEYNRMKNETFYLAQGAAERMVDDLARNTANFSSMTFPFTNTYTYSNSASVSCSVNTASANYTISEDGISKGAIDYVLTATASHPKNAEFTKFVKLPASSQINQVITLKRSTLYQYMVFYDKDLEMLPGAPMTLTGKVHSNASIYMGSETSGSLTVQSEYLHAVADIYYRRKNEVRDMVPPSIKVLGSTNVLQMEEDSRDADWGTYSQTRWNGTVQDRQQGVEVITPLGIPPITPGGYYNTQAGLKIVGTTAYNASGVAISWPTGQNPISQRSFYDFREGKTITVTQVDIGVLNTSGYFPANGLIYATRTDATASQPNGIRLVNGGTLSSNLTIVTNNPLYIKGNYNSTSKKSAAIISDSLNILSNNWNDSNSTYAKTSRVASDTTINAAFTSGGNQTTTGHYNGGLENYPRFHENWSSKDLNITGAFVSLWDSLIAQGEWGDASYSPPDRNWGYDDDLLTNPPPFTPIVVEVDTKSWWQGAKESMYL